MVGKTHNPAAENSAMASRAAASRNLAKPINPPVAAQPIQRQEAREKQKNQPPQGSVEPEKTSPEAKPADKPSKEEKMVERIKRIEELIKENWAKYIDKAKFKSPLKNRFIWYEDPNELISAKLKVCELLAERDIQKLTKNEKQNLINKYKSIEPYENPSFDKIKFRVIMDKKYEHFRNEFGGESVPAFYNPLDGKIYTSSDAVDVISHEALHYYGSGEFKEVFGSDLDEGMTVYLQDSIHKDYSSKYWKEDLVPISIPSDKYANNEAQIKEYIDSGALKKIDLIKGYLTGGKDLLVNLKEIMEKSDKKTQKKK